MDPLEISGAVIGIVGVWLMIRQRVSAWPVGLVQVVLYAWIFFQARVYSSALLQGVFFVILLYGWWLWWRGARDGGPAEAKVDTDGGASADADSGAPAHAGAATGPERSADGRSVDPTRRAASTATAGALPVTRLGTAAWVGAVSAGGAVTAGWGAFLARSSDAVLPYWDAGILGFSLVAQWLQARKKRENWLFWMGVNAAAMALYFSQGLRVTAALYAVFLGLAVMGWRAWRGPNRTEGGR